MIKKIVDFRNPKYTSADNQRIDLEILPEGSEEWWPLTVDINELGLPSYYEDIKSYLGGATIEPYVPDLSYQESLVQGEIQRCLDRTYQRIQKYEMEVRVGRTPADNSEALDQYIIAILDITNQAGYPENVSWPVEP